MSLEFKDWKALRQVLAERMASLLTGRRFSLVPNTVSVRVDDFAITLDDSEPEVVLCSTASKLSTKFAESLPPGTLNDDDDDLPVLVCKVHIKFSLGDASATLIVSYDQPVVDLAEYTLSVRCHRLSFKGTVELAICNNAMLVGIESLQVFDVEVSTSLGDSESKQLKSHQLDRFINGKLHRAIELLLSHPIILDKSTFFSAR